MNTKEVRAKLQNKRTGKIKYVTTYDVKVGDTLTFKWHEAWTVIKVRELPAVRTLYYKEKKDKIREA